METMGCFRGSSGGHLDIPYHVPAPGAPGAKPPRDEDATDKARARSAVETADVKAVRAAKAKLSAGEPKAIRKAVRILDQDK